MNLKLVNSISALLLCLFVSGIDCLAEDNQFGKTPSDFFSAEIRAVYNVHDFDAVDQMRIERGDWNDLTSGIGQALGHFPSHIELGAPDLNADLTSLPPILSPSGKVPGEQGTASAQKGSNNNTGNTDERINERNHSAVVLSKLLFMCNTVVGFIVGFLIVVLWARFGEREAITNALNDREGAVSNAADAPIDDVVDGWVKIAPFGTYSGSRPDRPQHFTETEANSMVQEFTSLRGKLGRLFRGVPIYIGHPDKDPVTYTDHRRLGRFSALEVRPDGLYGEPEWNALGEENLREGYWVYPSPRWDAPVGRATFRPDRLISVGLTNMPRIVDSEPVTNSSLDTETPTTPIMDRKLLTDKLGLDVTATDEEIMAKLAKLMDDAATADAKTQEAVAATAEANTAKAGKEGIECSLLEAQRKIIQFETALQTFREAHANSLLDIAIAAGRITQADRPTWLPRLTGESRESEANALAAIPPKLNTKSLDVSKSRVEIGDEKTRRESIANAVDTLMTTKGLSYHEAWNEAKKDPALKPLWDAMRTEA